MTTFNTDAVSTPVPSYSNEQRLIAACIIRAIQDYAIRHHPKFKTRYTQYINCYWERVIEIEEFFSDDHLLTPEPFSFPWMCQQLCEDWEGFRKKVLAYLERGDFSGLFAQRRCHKVYKELFH